MSEEANRRIVNNTFFLYVRSFAIMIISLFTSRIILQALGISDYGLYGAIGSIVAMFAILNSVLATGTSRFLTFELGIGNKEKIRSTFSASFLLHCAMAAFIFLLLETVGLWFVNYKMNIPEGRKFAANIIYQLSILSSALSLTQVPYNALIIAHEKMKIYAYVGITEALFKLIFVFALIYIPFTDNLIAYSTILTIWTIGLQIFYRCYCRKHFEESKLFICRDKSIYKHMLSYSVWDFIGQFCNTGNSQGLNILINMFFGVTMNAGRAIATQVENAIMQFANNFTTSLQPQIVKSYAQEDYRRFFELINVGAKMTFYLLLIFTIPIFFEANYILSIWLVEVPPKAVPFLRFILYYQLFRICTKTVVQGVHATGKIKILNLTGGCYSAGTFLLAIYICYKLGAPYWTCFIVQAFNGIILTYFEVRALWINIKFNRTKFFTSIYLNCFFVCILSCIPAICSIVLLPEGFIRFCITTATSLCTTAIVVLFVGLNKTQREKLIIQLRSKVLRKKQIE